MKCCICGKTIEVQANGWTGGHNPSPVKLKGRCCDRCNSTVVIPERLSLIRLGLRKETNSET